jgi:hypothetical protein
MSARLATSVLVSALLKKAEGEGGFGAVLAKGDATAGSVLLILLERGADPLFYERLLRPDGSYAWAAAPSPPTDVPALIARRRRFDPDLWVLELDIPVRERFAAEINAFG